MQLMKFNEYIVMYSQMCAQSQIETETAQSGGGSCYCPARKSVCQLTHCMKLTALPISTTRRPPIRVVTTLPC